MITRILVVGAVMWLSVVWGAGVALAQLEPREVDAILELAGDFKTKLESYQQEVTDLRIELFQCAKPIQDLIKNIGTATVASVTPVKTCLDTVLTQILPPPVNPSVGPSENSGGDLFGLRGEAMTAFAQLRAGITPLLRIKRVAELAKLLDSRWKSMRAYLSNELSAVSQGWQRIAAILSTLEAVQVLLEDANTYDQKREPDKAAALRAQAKQILQGRVWRTFIQATQLFSRSLTFLRHTQLMLNLLISDVIRREAFGASFFRAR